MIRSSWAVDDSIDQEEARVALSALMMPGLRDPASSPDQPIGRGGLRPGYTTESPVVPPGTIALSAPQDVSLQPFQLFLPSARASNGGVYVITSDELETIGGLLATPADATYSRIDRIVVQQNDMYYGDADSEARILHVVGSPASSPSVPGVPVSLASDPPIASVPGVAPPDVPSSADYFELASWIVPPGHPDLYGIEELTGRNPPANLADRYSVAAGGILPTTNDGREALTVRGWAGLTIFNMDTGVLEVLTGPGGEWKRQLNTSPVLNTLTADPIRQPIKIEGTLYYYKDDLYVYRAPGTMRRLTYTNVREENWMNMAAGSGMRVRNSLRPMARRIGNGTAMMMGQLEYWVSGHLAEIPVGAIIATLPLNLRPAYTQTAPIVTELGSTTSTTAKITIAADTGHIFYYAATAHVAHWMSFDNVLYSLDYPGGAGVG